MTHLTSSMIAGLVTTTITNPLDVVKTRMFVGGSRYPNAAKCAMDVFRKDGLVGFMKVSSAAGGRACTATTRAGGCSSAASPPPAVPVAVPAAAAQGWSASYARLGPHTVIMFLTAERLRKYAGLQSL